MGGVSRRRSWRVRIRSAAAVVVLLGLALPIMVVLPFRWISPPTSTFMLRYRVEAADDSSLRYQWTDWDHISPHVAVAVIAAEDQRFLAHPGFDIESIQDALADAERNGRLRGASTISQQVSKNLFLWPGRSMVRKGLEFYCTVFVELLWPKQRILQGLSQRRRVRDGRLRDRCSKRVFLQDGSSTHHGGSGCAARRRPTKPEGAQSRPAVRVCPPASVLDLRTDDPGRRARAPGGFARTLVAEE